MAGASVRIEATEERTMSVRVGDRIVIHGHKLGEPPRDCEVLEVRGKDGGSPYLVRWGDDGHESLFFPGNDATVQSFRHDQDEVKK
jgi:hypothetical protein